MTRPPRTHREAVERFYSAVAPENLARVDDLLARFEGQEHLLYRMLLAQFPHDGGKLVRPDFWKASLVDFYSVVAPDHLARVDEILAKVKGHEEQLVGSLRRMFPDHGDLIDRLFRDDGT